MGEVSREVARMAMVVLPAKVVTVLAVIVRVEDLMVEMVATRW